MFPAGVPARAPAHRPRWWKAPSAAASAALRVQTTRGRKRRGDPPPAAPPRPAAATRPGWPRPARDHPVARTMRRSWRNAKGALGRTRAVYEALRRARRACMDVLPPSFPRSIVHRGDAHRPLCAPAVYVVSYDGVARSWWFFCSVEHGIAVRRRVFCTKTAEENCLAAGLSWIRRGSISGAMRTRRVRPHLLGYRLHDLCSSLPTTGHQYGKMDLI